MYYRLKDEDRERYGGPEWVVLDPDELLDVPGSKLAAWERQIAPLTILDAVENQTSAASLRALMWLARKFVGVEDEAFADFDPAVLGAKVRREIPEDDSGKEPPTPSEPSEDSSDSAP